MLRRVDQSPTETLESGEAYLLNTGWAIGQNMYTPESIEVRAPVLDDRPYGAWLHYGILTRVSSANQRLWHWFEMDAGVIGPPALGEPAQRLVHHILGAPQPQGWANQIPAQLGAVLRYDLRYVLLDNAFKSHRRRYIDLTPSIGYVAGNLFTHASTSAMLRIGWNIPGASPEKIGPTLVGVRASDVPLHSVPRDVWQWLKPTGIYLFGGTEARVVAANSFVDRGAPRLQRETFVGELTGGLVIALQGGALTYQIVHRSREFSSQPGANNYGLISLTWFRWR